MYPRWHGQHSQPVQLVGRPFATLIMAPLCNTLLLYPPYLSQHLLTDMAVMVIILVLHIMPPIGLLDLEQERQISLRNVSPCDLTVHDSSYKSAGTSRPIPGFIKNRVFLSMTSSLF
ncbi:uncharacterized protein BDW70DRAFT_134932 [Aspergillus foveolatus]|uniref:uncharacterized protein n=1 Tax=Aspergillus foveolatus TaxID=210207 RepID=UPI003CCE4957